MGFPGRPKGSTNKRSNALALMLEKRGFNLAEKALGLYEESTDPEFKLRVITLLFPYVHAKQAEQPPDEHDVTPIEQMELDEMKRLYISGTKGLQELKDKIEEKERGQS